MNRLRLATALLGLALPAVGGDVNGHVLILKKLSKKVLSPTTYNLRGVAPTSAPLKMDDINEFDRTVVMIEGGTTGPLVPTSVVIEQRNGRFEPDLVVVPVGSTVQFPNADPIFHNVFSLSRTLPFDLGFYPKGQSRTVTFKKSGIAQVYCHIHASMYAAVVVTSSPWFGKPSADGSFCWENIPAGHYRVIAWHKVAGVFETSIDVPASGKVEVTIRVPVSEEPRH